MEIELTEVYGSSYCLIGFAPTSLVNNNYGAAPTVYVTTGGGYGGLPNLPGGTFVSGTILMVAYNTANNQMFVGKNGVWPVDPVTGTGAPIPESSSTNRPRITFMKGTGMNALPTVGIFKSKTFTYPRPTGYSSIV